MAPGVAIVAAVPDRHFAQSAKRHRRCGKMQLVPERVGDSPLACVRKPKGRRGPVPDGQRDGAFGSSLWTREVEAAPTHDAHGEILEEGVRTQAPSFGVTIHPTRRGE